MKEQVYESGCLMAYFGECPQHQDMIDVIAPADLHENGVEDSPHVTVLYGFQPGVTKEQLADHVDMEELSAFSILCTGFHVFENEEYDVLIYRVESSVLYDLNRMCRELPHQNNFPDYVPHMTLAYCKKGRARKYASQPFSPFLVKCDRLVYSAAEVDKEGVTHNVKYEWKLPLVSGLNTRVGHKRRDKVDG